MQRETERERDAPVVVLTPFTQWSRVFSQLAPPTPPRSSSPVAAPDILTALTVSMAPTDIRASITARWALCTNHSKENRELSALEQSGEVAAGLAVRPPNPDDI